ncbi:MAG: HupE/UreJ family protein [Methyloligella sp. ZOD6]
MKTDFLRVALVLVLAVAPTAAFAHVGVEPTNGFALGFMHPLGGVDHLLAMALVGIFAYQLGGRALVMLPVAFLSLMVLGGLAGIAHIPLPFVEAGIGMSVVMLGLAVAFHLKLPTALAMAGVGVFALMHGHAHGTEMPMQLSGAAYGAGFILATTLVLAGGIGLSALIGRMDRSSSVYRVAGSVAAVVGVFLLV